MVKGFVYMLDDVFHLVKERNLFFLEHRFIKTKKSKKSKKLKKLKKFKEYIHQIIGLSNNLIPFIFKIHYTTI